MGNIVNAVHSPPKRILTWRLSLCVVNTTTMLSPSAHTRHHILTDPACGVSPFPNLQGDVLKNLSYDTGPSPGRTWPSGTLKFVEPTLLFLSLATVKFRCIDQRPKTLLRKNNPNAVRTVGLALLGTWNYLMHAAGTFGIYYVGRTWTKLAQDQDPRKRWEVLGISAV